MVYKLFIPYPSKGIGKFEEEIFELIDYCSNR